MPSPWQKPRRTLAFLTFFPALLVLGSVLATSRRFEVYIHEISTVLGRILPAGSNTAIEYLRGRSDRPVTFLITTCVLNTWTASGVVISWMQGFRNAYHLPQTWGLVKERAIACSLVILAGIPLRFATILVAFGSQIEARILFHIGHGLAPPILVAWTAHALADCHLEQHFRDRPHLPQRRSPHRAMA